MRLSEIDQLKQKLQKMDHNKVSHLPIFEGDDDLKHHWFIFENIWDIVDITEKNKQIAQFVRSLRKRALTCYMNYIENQMMSMN